MKRATSEGFTLVEIMFAAGMLVVAFTALLGAFLGQLTLNEHANNLSLAVHDASRVIEQIRLDNTGCSTPEIDPSDLAGAPTSWDAWLAAQGKSVATASAAEERVFVTCLQRNPSSPPVNPTEYCGRTGTAQVGAGEWRFNAGTTTFNPIQVTVSVCWRHRNRTLGECSWDGTTLTAADGAGSGPNDYTGIIESPASMTTLVTCRG